MAAKVELRSARALVTGGGGGIGRATARALASEGAHVLVADIDFAAAEKVVAEIAERGGTAEAHELDVTDAGAVAALAAAVDRLDVVVANAGVGMSGRLSDMTLDDWRWIRSVNLDGVVHTCHAFGPAMLEAGHGHVVIVASGLAFTPRATEPAYCTTKAAALALAQCLRADWGRSGVGVSAVCPGVINTGILDHTRFVGAAADTEAKTRKAFRRGHKPETVARDVLRAINADKAIVTPGFESRIGWWLHRLAPIAVQQRIARQVVR
ncbi:MAG: SDR family NAD(P)-dependent oxidoreductase [Acidimicrobiales bacterium]